MTLGRSLLLRCLIAAGIGAVLALAWTGLLALIVTGAVCGGLGCLGLALLALPAALVVLAVLAWPLMMLFRIPRAWLAALLAPMPVIAFFHLFVPLIELNGSAAGLHLVGIVGAAALGYAVAALLSAPGLTPAWRTGLALPIALVLVWAIVLHVPSAPEPRPVPVQTYVVPAEQDPLPTR